MSMMICSVEGCKRAVACLCRHCQANVCVKHFNEHQNQVNEQLIPFTDRLNERKNDVLLRRENEFFLCSPNESSIRSSDGSTR